MKKIIINNEQLQILRESIKERLAAERKKVNTNPTDAQCKAGNYSMGHIIINGFEITIENPKGSYRCGRDKSGKQWKTYMHNDYGYFTRTVGKDGDAIDVFLGPYLEDKDVKIYPIDQFLNGEFDETKVMMGFRDKESAKAAYLSNYDKNWKGFKYISEVDIDTFKKWLYDGYRQRKPFAKYVKLTESKEKQNEKNSKCDKCGGDIVLQIHGEPVYICSKCGKYFGTMPCNLSESMINEKFSSKKLAKLANEHGGIEVSRNGGMRDGANAWQRGMSIDLSKVTDGMIEGEPFIPEKWAEEPNAICFNDGTIVRLKKYGEAPAPEKKSKESRYGTGIGDTGDHDRRPTPWNKDAKIQKQVYNGYGVSRKAGDIQHGREAINNNNAENDYVVKNPDKYKSPEKIIRNNNALNRDIKNRLLKRIDENELRKIILNAINDK